MAEKFSEGKPRLKESVSRVLTTFKRFLNTALRSKHSIHMQLPKTNVEFI